MFMFSVMPFCVLELLFFVVVIRFSFILHMFKVHACRIEVYKWHNTNVNNTVVPPAKLKTQDWNLSPSN